MLSVKTKLAHKCVAKSLPNVRPFWAFSHGISPFSPVICELSLSHCICVCFFDRKYREIPLYTKSGGKIPSRYLTLSYVPRGLLGSVLAGFGSSTRFGEAFGGDWMCFRCVKVTCETWGESLRPSIAKHSKVAKPKPPSLCWRAAMKERAHPSGDARLPHPCLSFADHASVGKGSPAD